MADRLMTASPEFLHALSNALGPAEIDAELVRRLLGDGDHEAALQLVHKLAESLQRCRELIRSVDADQA